MFYTTQVWTMSGETQFDFESYKLLNPSIQVKNVTLSTNNLVILSLVITENNGIYEHHSSFQYKNETEESNINAIVNTAMLEKFPESTVTPEFN